MSLYSVTFETKKFITEQLLSGAFITTEETIIKTIHDLPYSTARSYRDVVPGRVEITQTFDGPTASVRRSRAIEVRETKEITPVETISEIEIVEDDYAELVTKMARKS